MKSRWIKTALLLLLVIPAMTACGIPREEYNVMANEVDLVNAQLALAKTENQELSNNLNRVEAELDSEQERLQDFETDLKEVKTELMETQTQLYKKDIDLEEIKAENDFTTKDLKTARDMVEAGNAKLKRQQYNMEQAKILADLLATVFIPVMENRELSVVEQTKIGLEFLAKISSSDDAQLQGLLAECIDSKFGEQDSVDLYVYILKALPALLSEEE